MTPERIAYLKDKFQSWPGEMALTSEDIADLLLLLDEAEELRQIKAGEGATAREAGTAPAPSPGLSDADERALDVLQDAAREGYPYVCELESDRGLWWADVLKALAHLRSRLSATPAPPCACCDNPATEYCDGRGAWVCREHSFQPKPAPPASNKDPGTLGKDIADLLDSRMEDGIRAEAEFRASRKPTPLQARIEKSMTAPSEKMTTEKALEELDKWLAYGPPLTQSGWESYHSARNHLTALAEDYEKVKAEVERLRKDNNYFHAGFDSVREDFEEQKARAEKAEAELARYKRFDKLIEAAEKTPLDSLRHLVEIVHGDESGNRVAILRAALKAREK